MEKKASPNIAGNLKPKISGFSGRVFGMIKFILGICLLPFVYSASLSFLNEFSLIEKSLQNYFWSGLISLIAIYLFVWEPAIIYTKGQKLLEVTFSFFKPLVRIAPYLLPIYAIILFIVYWFLSSITKSPKLLNYFLFLFGFSMGLHLIFGARSLRSKQEDFLKANYIFGFSFVYILNLILAAFILNLIFGRFSVVNFFNNSFQSARNIFYAVFKQLFL